LCHVLAWRESTPFSHKNKQKLVCKTANTPSRQDPQTNRGGGASGGSFWLYQIWLLAY
jgi:hypothetical protein